MGLAVLFAAVVLCIIVVACIPVTYRLTAHIGTPFHLSFAIRWLGRAFCYRWEYTYGQRPKTTIYWRWKRRTANAPAAESPSSRQIEDAVRDALKQDKAVTYDELKDAALPSASSGRLWPCWLSDGALLKAGGTWLYRLMAHGMIRYLTITGTLGLARPHETGMAAGLLYAAIPGSITDLRFSFTEEYYDCTIRSAGRLYPAVCIGYTAAFIVSRPVRTRLARHYQRRRGHHHG